MRIGAVGFAVTLAKTPSFEDPLPTGPDGLWELMRNLSTTRGGRIAAAVRLSQFIWKGGTVG